MTRFINKFKYRKIQKFTLSKRRQCTSWIKNKLNTIEIVSNLMNAAIFEKWIKLLNKTVSLYIYEQSYVWWVGEDADYQKQTKKKFKKFFCKIVPRNETKKKEISKRLWKKFPLSVHLLISQLKLYN